MKIRTTFYTNLAIMALAACLPLGTAAWANSIPGTSLTPTVWWSADAANNVTNNGLVSQLTDQSGNGNNAVQDTQNGTPLPFFATNVINGLPALSFGGTNSLISPTGATTGNSSHSIFIVASYQSIAQYRNGAVFYSDTAGSDQNSCLGVNPAGSTIWVGGYNEDNAPYVGSISLNVGGFNILSKIYTASLANYQGFVSGVQDVNASGATYNLGNTRVGLGKQYNNGSYWAGDIAEVIVFNSALSYSDLEAVQQYLANKYNLPLALPAISLTPANATLLGTNNTVLTLTIPQAANASQAVSVTVTNNNPGVVSLQGTVGNILTVTFPAGATNVQSVVVTGVGAGQASLTYASASPGLVPAGPATINVVVGVSVIPVTGGDPGQGFSPLPIDVAAVDFDSHSPNQTIQGVSFTAGIPTPEGGINVNPGSGFGGYNSYTAPTFTPTDANNTAMSAVFGGLYYANNNLQQSTIGGNEYGQYQFTGLSIGQTYQVDLFTIADSNPRYTLTQVIGATTNSYDVLTALTPTIVSYTAMTPDANGDITVQYCWGPGSVAGSGNSANSGLVSAIALTTGNSTTLPMVTNSSAAGILSTSATIGGSVIANGGFVPIVTIYYGTSDGGTNAAAWAKSVALGSESGSFSTVVTGLTPSTTYYFTAAATNIAGLDWATPSLAFTTPAILPSVITNVPALNVQSTSAMLGGQVVSTGSQVPTVTVYYGTANGGTNAGAWANNDFLGAQSGSFAVPVEGLATNTTYFFTASASNSAGVVWATPSKTFTTLATAIYQPVYTYHYDNTRQGANTNETFLTLSDVNTNTFGLLFTYPVDNFVFAQALVATNVTVPGKGTHNLLIVATANDTVYAFDADTYVPIPYWTKSFINPAAGIIACPASASSGITPGNETGITATPVIDPSTGTLYVEARTQETVGSVVNYPHRLHALDLTTGQEKVYSPVLIQCTNYPGTGTPGQNDTDGNGHVLWNGLREHCRPALLLANGMVYITYASPGDHPPYYGWVFSYNAQTLAQTGVFNTAPNTGYSGVWMVGNGPLADANGFIYLNTGNGTFQTNVNAYGDSILKLNGTNGLQLVDYFAPYNTANLASGDWDISSAGMCMLPSVNGTNLLLSGSKLGTLYVLNRDNLGGWTSATGNPNAVQSLTGPLSVLWGSPAYFNGMIYIQPCGGQSSGSDTLKSFALSGLTINPMPTAVAPEAFGYPGGTPTVSANGTLNAIVWEIETDGYNSGGQAILHAFNATNIAQELYNSSQIPQRDSPGVAVLYSLPIVANGKVYVGTQFGMSVYGLNFFLAQPTISPGGEIYSSSVVVTLADSTPGTTLYYTLDGSIPGTNSTLYTGPFTLTNSVAVNVVATKPGSANSAVTTASFLNSSAVGSGTGLLGAYYANHTSASPYTGSPTLVSTDAIINFDWDSVGPDPSIGQTVYTVRWTGSVQPQFDETYTFYATADDGVRLWVNGQELINGWVDQPSTTYQGSITLKAQQLYNIEMDYYQNGGGAVAELQWSSPSTTKQIIPQTQLYPYTNPPPGVVLNSPANNVTYTAGSSVTLNATAMAQYNTLDHVAFYANSIYLGSVSNVPYTLTLTGLTAGSYALAAVAVDGTGLSTTSAPPVNITINPGSGLPYGLNTRPSAPAFFNMPTSFNGAFPGSIPALLSQTGVFSNTPAMIPTNCFISYVPNTALWSDNAVKTRWMSVPYAGGLETPDQQIGFFTNGEWSFPGGTVFVKVFELVTDQTNPNAPLRRLETRLLVRDINGAVYGVTYKWRPDNSDADLLTNSLNESILITNTSGVSTQTWYYPSPADCLTCHTAAANYVLGVKTAQLNGNFTYPSGVTDNQLRTLNRLGIFNPSFDEAQISSYSQMVAVTNLAANLTNRFKSYIDANCAQCHRPGGTGHSSMDARYDTPLSNQNIINGVPFANLGYDNASIVKPHDVWRSILYDRINSVNPTIQMPPLARNLIDSNAVAAITAFINSLPGTPALAPPTLAPTDGTFSGLVSIVATATSPIYYTLDGSLPTTNSMLYTGPIVLTSSAIVSASAFQSGYVNSVTATGSFTVLPILFTSPGSFTNGVFQLQLSASANQTYVLQASTNLTQWVIISTNTPSTTPFWLTDTNSLNFPKRFYRVLLQQP